MVATRRVKSNWLACLVDGAETLRLAGGDAPGLPDRVQSIVIVGATCAGKTTVSAAIRRRVTVGGGRVEVPKRYVTRPPRRNDCTIENCHVSRAEFDGMLRRDDIRPHWVRRFESGREERYGFARARRGALPVYSANNALLDAATLWPTNALEGALIVGVYAPDRVREERLRRRSPDLCAERPDEVAHRMADRSATVLSRVHVVVDNHGAGEAYACDDVIDLVEFVM